MLEANRVVIVPKLPPPVIWFKKNAVRTWVKSMTKPAITKLKLIKSAATIIFHQSCFIA